jgi:hypothetical protein
MINTCVCCGDIIPEGRQVCLACEKWESGQSKYMKFDCPECGARLEVMSDSIIEQHPARFDLFRYERRQLIRHCRKCLHDWENEWWTENGDVGESQLRRKFWG